MAEYSDIYEINRRDLFAVSTGSKNLAQWIRNPWVMDSDLPSEHPYGRPEHDADFVAGFRAGQNALSRDPDLTVSDARQRYRQVSDQYGSWWTDGFATAIEVDRGHFDMKYVNVARRLGLDRGRWGG